MPALDRSAIDAAAAAQVALRAEEAEAERWQVFGIEQTGQLAKANGRTSDVLEIVTTCEARDAAAARHINAPFWAFWR